MEGGRGKGKKRGGSEGQREGGKEREGREWERERGEKREKEGGREGEKGRERERVKKVSQSISVHVQSAIFNYMLFTCTMYAHTTWKDLRQWRPIHVKGSSCYQHSQVIADIA